MNQEEVPLENILIITPRSAFLTNDPDSDTELEPYILVKYAK